MTLSTGLKRLILIILFIVPCLGGMVLIFKGRNAGKPLPKYHQSVFNTPKGDSIIDYIVPEQKFDRMDGEKYYWTGDSSIYLFTFFSQRYMGKWNEQVAYISHLLDKYEGAQVVSVFEAGNLGSVIYQDADPAVQIDRYKLWESYKLPKFKFQRTLNDFKISKETLDTCNFVPYVLIDKERRIRMVAPVKHIKDVREVKKRVKYLHNEYAREKIELRQKR